MLSGLLGGLITGYAGEHMGYRTQARGITVADLFDSVQVSICKQGDVGQSSIPLHYPLCDTNNVCIALPIPCYMLVVAFWADVYTAH